MSSESQQGEISDKDSQFSVDLKTNKIKKKTKKKKQKKLTPKIITSTYKKQRCMHYNKGNCTKGDTCTFSHDFEPQSSKIICKYFLSNSCSKGQTCNFSHSTQQYPCRFYHLENRCNQGAQCRFSHGAVNKDYLNDFIKQNKQLILNLWKEQKLNTLEDKNLKRQIITFINKELAQQPQQHQKRHSFKGQLKLLAKNNIQLNQQPIKPKPIDPRLKIKVNKPFKVQQPQQLFNENTQLTTRSWLIEVAQKKRRFIKNEDTFLDIRLIQKFLYSYY